MNHKQILDKMAAGNLVTTLDQEVARLTFTAMAGHKNNWIDNKLDYVITRLMPRWNSLVKHHAQESVRVEIFNIVLAIILHKYGFQVQKITDAAIESIERLNKKTILSDSFFHKEDEIKSFLIDKPKELTRYPRQAWPLTYYRPKDIVSFEVDGKYIAAYVYGYSSSAPIVAFFDLIFEKPPFVEQLVGQRAYGKSYAESERPDIKYFEKYAINGMTYIPDPAEQITIIASAIDIELDITGMEESNSICTHIELDDVREIFKIIEAGG